jgi:hypothetical protein
MSTRQRSQPFGDVDALLATAERCGGVLAPVQALPFAFGTRAAAEAFCTAVQADHPAFLVGDVQEEVPGKRFVVDVHLEG